MSRTGIRFKRKSKTAQTRKTVAPKRGYERRAGGRSTHIEKPREFYGTSRQLAGLFPFHNRSLTSGTGVWLGRETFSGQPVAYDPVSAFQAKQQTNPSTIILGQPGKGKSTLIRSMVVGCAGRGTTPVIFADLKNEYSELILELGGSVFKVGQGFDTLNILDPGSMKATAASLPATERDSYLATVQAHRLNLLAGLIDMNRRDSDAVSDHEITILAVALRVLDNRFETKVPVLNDLIELLAEKPPEVRHVAVADDNEQTLSEVINPLRRSLVALSEGAYGDIFAHHTSQPLDLSKPLCIDISSAGDDDLVRAVLWACWVEGFSSIDAEQKKAAAKGEPPLNFLVVIDELWRVLSSGSVMIRRLDSLVRLDRSLGIATLLGTHGATDLDQVAEEDKSAARGLMSKIGARCIFGLSREDISVVSQYITLNDVEKSLLEGWSGDENPDGGRAPGVGKMLLKRGRGPGLPVDLVLTATAKQYSDTNQRWDMGNNEPPTEPESPAGPEPVIDLSEIAGSLQTSPPPAATDEVTDSPIKSQPTGGRRPNIKTLDVAVMKEQLRAEQSQEKQAVSRYNKMGRQAADIEIKLGQLDQTQPAAVAAAAPQRSVLEAELRAYQTSRSRLSDYFGNTARRVKQLRSRIASPTLHTPNDDNG